MHIEVWLADLVALAPSLEAEEWQTPRLSEAENTRARGMTEAGHVRRDWRAAHIALRLLIERRLGPQWRGVNYAMSRGGRPELEGAPLSFSLSHTGGLGLFALARAGPIGADIERLRTIALSADRQAAIIAHGAVLIPSSALSGEADARFLQAWVRLEAVAKASGEGMGALLSGIGIFGPHRGAKAPSSALRTPAFAVRDIDAGACIFAAVAAPELPETLVLRPFPQDAAAFAAFTHGRA